MVKEEEVMHALQAVEDPELDISIVDLGLVYAVRLEDRDLTWMPRSARNHGSRSSCSTAN